MAFEEEIAEVLRELDAAGLLRAPRRISGPQGPEILVDGKPVLCFCSNNYLGLANHPAILEAAHSHALADGFGSGASRLITGTMAAHEEAERMLADFVGAPDAVLFSSGYAANLGTIQALIGPEDMVFSDALNHASLIDGCRLSRAAVRVYQHRDSAHLESLLRNHRTKARRALIVTDTLFSMDGVIAPLSDLRALAERYDAALFVDEAHALGVLGPNGRGLCAAQQVKPDVLVGTLGKAFGGAGAFVAASEAVVSLIRNLARSYVYSTAPPPSQARVAIEALKLVRHSDQARATLLAHANHLRAELGDLGYDVPAGESQIIPVLIGDNHRTMQLSAELLEHGVFVQGIRPPTVPPGTSRLRLTPMATHEREQIDHAIDSFARVLRR